MRLDHLRRELRPAAELPLALQVARALAGAIQRGELRPGEALPGTRPLAESLGVSRYAVLGALQELELDGFVEVRQGSGAYVAAQPPAAAPASASAVGGGRPPAGPAFDLPSQLLPITAVSGPELDLSEGYPDARLAPQEALARAYQRAVKRHGDRLLGVGEPKGNATLRAELAHFLRSHRGLHLDPEQILVTRGLRNGLDLILAALFPKGGVFALEVPRTADLWETAVRHPGVRMIGLPRDLPGGDPATLVTAATAAQPRALLLRGPSDAAATALLEAATAARWAVLEDDSAFPFGGPGLSPLPLAAADRAGVVIHLLSFGRLVAPGLRIGLLTGPRQLIDRLARLRRSAELQGDRVQEWALADLLRDGDLDRHLRRAASEYAHRANAFAAGLEERLGRWIEVGPRDGLLQWVAPRPGFDLDRWVEACRGIGVKLRPPAGHGLAAARLALGYAVLADAERARALDLLQQAAAQVG